MSTGNARSIAVLRGRRVPVDSRLAALYGVTTRRLNEQVRRNRSRFPDDFSFEPNPEEFAALKSHSATSGWGARRTLPIAFTEHGAIQAATILSGIGFTANLDPPDGSRLAHGPIRS